MGKINQHIEIVSSAIFNLSSMGQTSREAAARELSRHYRRVGITLVNDLSDLEALVDKAPDLVLLGMKSIPKNSQSGTSDNQKIWLADYLAERGIATTGSHSTAHRYEINKPLAKQRVADAGINTSNFCVVAAGQQLDPSQLPGSYPLFVKPADRGGGAGIDSDSIVTDLLQLEHKVSSISREFKSDSLIEEYLPGREFSVAVLMDESRDGLVAMPLELVAPKDKRGARMLSSAVKLADAERTVPVTDSELRDSIIDLAIGAFEAIGGRDYGRIDIRMDAHGTPHFLEANLIPSLINNYGSFPKACALNEAIGYGEMLLRIVELGLARATSPDESLELVPQRSIVQSAGI